MLNRPLFFPEPASPLASLPPDVRPIYVPFNSCVFSPSFKELSFASKLLFLIWVEVVVVGERVAAARSATFFVNIETVASEILYVVVELDWSSKRSFRHSIWRRVAAVSKIGVARVWFISWGTEGDVMLLRGWWCGWRLEKSGWG